MQQIYRGTPMPKLLCNFIEVALRYGCFPVCLQHIFRTPFPKNTSGSLLLVIFIWILFFNTWKKQKQTTKIKQSKKQKIRHFGHSISNNFGKFSFNKGFSSRTESGDSAKIQKQPPEVFFKKRCKAYNRLSHRCFHVNFAKFLRTAFSQNISGRLLLEVIRDIWCLPECLSIQCHFTLNVLK